MLAQFVSMRSANLGPQLHRLLVWTTAVTRPTSLQPNHHSLFSRCIVQVPTPANVKQRFLPQAFNTILFGIHQMQIEHGTGLIDHQIGTLCDSTGDLYPVHITVISSSFFVVSQRRDSNDCSS
ncbi:hypothetical protein Tco_0555391 [Tanacetum coccineum]